MDIYIGFSLQIYVIQVRRKPTGGVACIKTLSTSSVGLPQLAFDNIEALASGESSAYRCYGIGDVDCHGDKVDKMYSGYSLK